MIYRKFGVCALVTILAGANLSMTSGNHEWVLTEEDRLMEESQDSPALSSVIGEEPAWESLNEWRCFPIEAIEPSCVGVAWDPEKKPGVEEPMPSLAASANGETFYFDYEEAHFKQLDCEAVLAEWKGLLAGEKSACIYGAYLQDAEDNATLWTLFGLKTSKGYWPPKKSEFFSTTSVARPAENNGH